MSDNHFGTGAGRGAFFRPRPEWVRPVLDWIAAGRN